MILKIRRELSHADSCRGIPKFLIIDNIESADFVEFTAERTKVADGSGNVHHEMYIPDDGGNKMLLGDASFKDVIIHNHNIVGNFPIGRAILNIRKSDDKVSNEVYYFDTQAFLMNDHGETIERLTPGLR